MSLQILRDVRITARDGVELSANVFLPGRVAADGSGGMRVPAILNIDPYRKDDWSSGWDLTLATYFAERGYAYCRLDVRGTGSSGGVAHDEYTEAETLDGHDTVEWLAAQAWCTGSIGMWGLSYGGFTAIQVAATRPPHLRAIVPVQATDDRYTDDVHYVGGAKTLSELSQYAVSQVAMNALPAMPSARGDGWLDDWRARLESTPVWLFRWAREQRDGPYWRQGSLAPAYERIEAAILHITGWMDAYVDAAVRMQARCCGAVARRTLVGPWVHGTPHSAYPAPNIDWLHEAVRWFDRFLKGEANGVDAEPPLTWFHRDPTPPERFPKRLEGEWRAAAAWPPSTPRALTLSLDEMALRAEPATVDGADSIFHSPIAGSRAGSLCWGAGHPPNGLALDLRLEDGSDLVYASAPLQAPVDILGVPVATIHVSSAQPVAHLVARLAAVAPDGVVEQVCEGILNLTHRDSHADPAPLEPGRRYEVRLPLRVAGYRFPAEYRIQLRLTSAHWPVIWPSSGENRLMVFRGPAAPSRLELPLAPTGAESVAPPALREDRPVLQEFDTEVSEATRWEQVDDAASGDLTTLIHEGATTTLPDGVSSLYVGETLGMTASRREPGSGRFENACEYRLDREGHRIRVVADGTTIASATAFDMTVGLHVELDGEGFFERSWHEVVPRDLL